MSTGGPIDSVMLIGFGGPTRREEIRPFLDDLLRGRPVARERYEEVVRHYEAIGGRSPYNENTIRQARALSQELARGGVHIPVRVGMRNCPPYISDVLGESAKAGARRIFGFILAAHRCEASFDRYADSVRDAQLKLGQSAPEVIYPGPWHTHPGFIEALSDTAKAALAQLDPASRRDAHLIFTAHDVPRAMAEASNYAGQVEESARMVAATLGRQAWTIAFQSGSGTSRNPWLEPNFIEMLKQYRGRAVVVVPLGFLCDHVEILYDLDIEAQELARESEITMKRAATVGVHPAFIRMVAGLVRQHLEAQTGGS